jgi:nucleotide-binding universal stress UspA family protein
MEPIKTILVPVDFEAASLAALRTALELARPNEANVVLLHAFSVPPYVYRGISEALLKQIRDQARDAALRPLNDLRSRWGVETLLREGDPATQVLRVADEIGADRIVMGTHGHRGFDRFMFGSVAEAVVRKSKVPVMVVRPEEDPARARHGKPIVLCATDYQPGSRPALELAGQYAAEIAGTLELVHAYAVPFYVYPGFDALLAGQLDAELRRAATRTLEALAKEYGAERHHLVAGEAGRSILDVAKERGAAAIVMGTHGRHGLGRFFLGSVAEWVLRRSPVPVLTTHVTTEAEAAEAQARPQPGVLAGRT